MFDTRAVPAAADPVDPEARRARLAAVAEQVRPVALAREHTLPVVAPLTQLFPEGALPRGITITIDGTGAASVALALAAAPVQAGSWVAFVDLPGVNLAAAAEAGVALERVACITTGEQWAPAVAALLGAFDVVIVGRARRLRAGDVRRLAARARERGSVLVGLGGTCGAAVWPDAPDLGLRATAATWTGLGAGHGHLQACTVRVQAEGRRSFARLRVAELGLPGGPRPASAVAAVAGVGSTPEVVAPVVPIARAG